MVLYAVRAYLAVSGNLFIAAVAGELDFAVNLVVMMASGRRVVESRVANRASPRVFVERLSLRHVFLEVNRGGAFRLVVEDVVVLPSGFRSDGKEADVAEKSSSSVNLVDVQIQGFGRQDDRALIAFHQNL